MAEGSKKQSQSTPDATCTGDRHAHQQHQSGEKAAVAAVAVVQTFGRHPLPEEESLSFRAVDLAAAAAAVVLALPVVLQRGRDTLGTLNVVFFFYLCRTHLQHLS